MKLLVARTLEEYINVIDQIKRSQKYTWFRGMRKASFTLMPSLFREKRQVGLRFSGRVINGRFYRKSDAIMKSDLAAIDAFIESYKRFYPEKCQNFNLIDYLYIMQHYEIPTRLLDFSTNEFIALYFSVAGAELHGSSGSLEEEISDFHENYGYSDLGSSVQVIDPVLTNSKTNAFENIKDDVLNIDDISHDALSRIDLPICVSTTNQDKRIVTQQGVFMLFGADYRSYDQYKVLEAEAHKIFIPNSCRPRSNMNSKSVLVLATALCIRI